MAKAKQPPAFNRGYIVALWVITIGFAAFGAVGWLVAFWGVNTWMAIGIASAFFMAPVGMAVVTGPLVKAKSKVTLVLLALSGVILAGMDAGGNTNAFWQFETLWGSPQVERFDAQVAADKAVAQADLSTANSKLDGIVLPTHNCLCPQTKAADLALYNGQRAGPLADKATALTALAEIAKRTPPEPRMLPKEVSGGIFAALSFALFAAFIGVHRNANEREAEWKAAQPKPVKRAKRKPPVKKAAPMEALWTPKVVANEN